MGKGGSNREKINFGLACLWLRSWSVKKRQLVPGGRVKFQGEFSLPSVLVSEESGNAFSN